MTAFAGKMELSDRSRDLIILDWFSQVTRESMIDGQKREHATRKNKKYRKTKRWHETTKGTTGWPKL
jgi:hypothetical protein